MKRLLLLGIFSCGVSAVFDKVCPKQPFSKPGICPTFIKLETLMDFKEMEPKIYVGTITLEPTNFAQVERVLPRNLWMDRDKKAILIAASPDPHQKMICSYCYQPTMGRLASYGYKFDLKAYKSVEEEEKDLAALEIGETGLPPSLQEDSSTD